MECPNAGPFKVKGLAEFLSKHAAEAPAKDADTAQGKAKTDPDTDAEADDGKDNVVPQVQQILLLQSEFWCTMQAVQNAIEGVIWKIMCIAVPWS